MEVNNATKKILQSRSFFWIMLAFALLALLFALFYFDSQNKPSEVYVYLQKGAKISEIQKKGLDQVFSEYLSERRDDSDKWLVFVNIFSTLLAVFFVYSGFKIDASRSQIDDAEKRIYLAEKMIKEDILEYANQLQYATSFILSKEYNKAIDALMVLRDSSAVLRDDRKINTCNFYLTHCYYEKGLQERSIDDLALAVEYAEEAYEAKDQPFKLEVISAFNKLKEEKNV